LLFQEKNLLFQKRSVLKGNENPPKTDSLLRFVVSFSITRSRRVISRAAISYSSNGVFEYPNWVHLRYICFQNGVLAGVHDFPSAIEGIFEKTTEIKLLVLKITSCFTFPEEIYINVRFL
jgi:hypothetical protein